MKISKLKNLAILFLLKLFPKQFHDFDPLNPKILVVSTTALGDTLWSTPAIRAIKKRYPKSKLFALVSKVGYEILKNDPNLDKLILLNEPLWIYFLKLYKELKKEKFQAILIFHSSQRLILPLCYLLNSGFLVGNTNINKGLDHLLSHPIAKKEIHEIQRRAEIIKTIGADCNDFKMSYFFEEKKDFVNSMQIISPLIIFHPGAKDFFRAIPANIFIELGQKLKTFFKSTIIITGTEKERALIESISKKIDGSLSLCNLNLEELASIFKRSNLIIVGDTGPLHLSLALNKKVLTLFVPTSVEKFGPYKVDNCHVIKKPRTCKVCTERDCKNPTCFDQITQEELFSTCIALLK